MSTIQIRRSAAAAPVVMPVAGPAGELAYARGGFTDLPAHAPSSNDLVISDGSAMQVVVGATRQLEIGGAQTVVGVKTFPIASLIIPGGAANDFLKTDGAGGLSWGPAAIGGMTAVATDGVTIQGDGVAGTPVALITGIFTGTDSGLTYAPGAVAVAPATQTVFGGIFIATDAEVIAGTADDSAITPRSLRAQLGADATTLTTPTKTVIPAINELHAALISLSGVLTLCGSYDAATDAVVSNNPRVPSGTLPAPAAGNTNCYLVVTAAGIGTGEAPAVDLEVGSWIVSDGTAWIYVDLVQSTNVASNIEVNPPVLGATDVQDALEAIAAVRITTDLSLSGTGETADPLIVAVVDGGVY